jgi:hypothetical protein
MSEIIIKKEINDKNMNLKIYYLNQYFEENLKKMNKKNKEEVEEIKENEKNKINYLKNKEEEIEKIQEGLIVKKKYIFEYLFFSNNLKIDFNDFFNCYLIFFDYNDIFRELINLFNLFPLYFYENKFINDEINIENLENNETNTNNDINNEINMKIENIKINEINNLNENNNSLKIDEKNKNNKIKEEEEEEEELYKNNEYFYKNKLIPIRIKISQFLIIWIENFYYDINEEIFSNILNLISIMLNSNFKNHPQMILQIIFNKQNSLNEKIISNINVLLFLIE